MLDPSTHVHGQRVQNRIVETVEERVLYLVTVIGMSAYVRGTKYLGPIFTYPDPRLCNKMLSKMPSYGTNKLAQSMVTHSGYIFHTMI